MANYYCDPKWHLDISHFPANFLILPLPEERTFGSDSFACCRLHVGKALDIMLEKFKQVTVHKVKNEDT